VKFLDPTWFDALNEALAGVDVDGPAIVIQQHITIDATPNETLEYFVAAAGGAARVERGIHPSPTVELSQTRQTAEDVHTGAVNALTAFQQGLINVAGDVQALIGARAVLEALDAAAAQIG
jgi:hypothetical protein